MLICATHQMCCVLLTKLYNNLKTKEAIRPLTKQMITKLRECRQMEQNDQPCLPKHFSASLSGLYKRKFVDVRARIIDGREVMCVYITPSGAEYLDLLAQEDHVEGSTM